MATTYLGLVNGCAAAGSLAATAWNQMAGAQDRGGGLMMYSLFSGGRKTGWSLQSGTSTVTSGTGQVGACWCSNTASQAISGLSAATCYVFAKADSGAAASGTVDFVARTTSTAITNYDGITPAVLLGKAHYNTTTGMHTIDSSIRTNWQIDHGGLAGLSDDDHPDYMRPIEVNLYGASAIYPATSTAATSTYGTNFPATIVKYPALSTARAGWDYACPADYSGTITVHTDWVSSGTGGNIRLCMFARSRAHAESWDTAVASTMATVTLAISGTAGHLRHYSHSWTTAKPTAGERGTFVIRRDGANASDTCSGAARLLGARVVFATAR